MCLNFVVVCLSGANTEGRAVKAEDSVINQMKSRDSQKTTDYLSAEHIFTSSAKEMSESPSEQTEQPLLKNVNTAYKTRQNKVHTTTIETTEILHNIPNLEKRNRLKSDRVADGLGMNSGESNSQLGSSIDKSHVRNIDGNRRIQISPVNVNKPLKHSSSRKVKASENMQKRNNKRSKLNETGQNRQTDAINKRKTADMGLAVNYLSSTETPDSLQNVGENNRALFVVQKFINPNPTTHRTHNSLDSKKYKFLGTIKSKKTEKPTNKKRKKKKKIKTNRIRNKSLNVTSKNAKTYFNDVSASTEFHRVSFSAIKRGEKDEYHESSNKNESDRFTKWNRLPERVDQKQSPNAEKLQKETSFDRNLMHKDHSRGRTKLLTDTKIKFLQDVTFFPKLILRNSRNLISTAKPPFRLFRYKARNVKKHSLNEHDHFQKPVGYEGSLPDKTVKQSSRNPDQSIVTTIRNVLKPGKGKESTQQNISHNFEVSKLFYTTQSESTLKGISNQYGRRFKYNKPSYITLLPLTKILNEKNPIKTTIVPKKVKNISETDLKPTELNEKESKYTNNIKHEEVTESTNDQTKWMFSDKNLKLTTLPSKTSTDLNNHLLNRDSNAPNFISTTEYRHLHFENTIIKQTFNVSVTNPERNSSIQINNSNFSDEVQSNHENFSSKSSKDQFFISELSTDSTVLSSSKGSSQRSLHGNTKTKKTGKSKITRKQQFTTPETELIYQTVNPKYSSSKVLRQNTTESKTNHEQKASQKDIYFNDPTKLLFTRILHNTLTKLPENVSFLQGLVPQSSTTRSENYKSENSIAASSERSSKEIKSPITINYIEDFTQTSIAKVSDGISVRNVDENKYNSSSLNPTNESYKHLSTSPIPKELFPFPLDNSTPPKSIVDEKHWMFQISSTATKDPKTNEHTIFTTKYDVLDSTSELPAYSQDTLVSTIMTNSQHKASSSHTTATHQHLFQTTKMPALRISPNARDVSTQNLSPKATKILRQTFPKLYSKIIVEPTSATTDKISTSRQKSVFNRNTTNHTFSSLYQQPVTTQRTQLSSTRHLPYTIKRVSKRHTTPQTTNISSQRTPFLATKSLTQNRPQLPTTLPTQHTSSLTILPLSTISTRNTNSHTIKLSSRTKLTTTSKFSNPHILSSTFSNSFITTAVTSKTHKPNGSIQSEATQKNSQYDFTSMTQTMKPISKDNYVPTPNTQSSNSVTPSPESVRTPSQTLDTSSSPKVYQHLLVVCKVDTSEDINSDQFQNNIRNGKYEYKLYSKK